MSACDVCGKAIMPWQKSEDFQVRTTLGAPVMLHAHRSCASTVAVSAHMKTHRRTILCNLLGCTSNQT